MRPKRGIFTLIEVVIASGLLVVVLTLAGLLMDSVLRTHRMIEGTEQRLRQLQTVDQVLDSTIRNAVPFYWKDPHNNEIMLFTGESERLYLTCLHPINDRSEGGLRFLRLFMSHRQLIAEYRARPMLAEAEFTAAEQEVLATGIKRIKFTYADLDQGELRWYDIWEIETMKNMPVAIQLAIEFEDGQYEVWLRRTAGAGRNQQLGTRKVSKK